ncbi:MAG: ATP-binding cassette domain-containing protein [Treponema sp.]|jgi:ABC-type uncharacterized transport system ATPase subunit|nr:ATP-binding cassette domain-containing protein [Treponema sp.]
MVELRSVHKYFSSNGVTALCGADLQLRKGEIHALAGENGAGKSTLMHIMAGFMRPSSGEIYVDGKRRVFYNSDQALNAGIGMVPQHPHLVPGFTVWENCILGAIKKTEIIMNKKALFLRVARLNEKWRFHVPLKKQTGDLTVSEIQKSSALALLLRDTRCLVFDEPGAALTLAETQNLFELFFKLKEDGKTVVIISHKLEEMISIADRITVLRGGKTAAVLSRGDFKTGETRLSSLIFGNEEAAAQTVKPAAVKNNAAVLELNDFTVAVSGRPLIRGVDLELRRGSILGIAGVRDSGIETLELAIAGFLPSTGRYKVNGNAVEKRTPLNFRRAGGAYLGARNEGAALPLEMLMVIHAHRRLKKYGFLRKKALREWTARIMKYASVPDHLYRAPGAAFSGGQLQNMLLMREYAEDTALLVLAEPGRNLDRRSCKRLSRVLTERAANGGGILLFSSDCDELLSLCGEIRVLQGGKLSPGIPLDAENPRDIMVKAMVGA